MFLCYYRFWWYSRRSSVNWEACFSYQSKFRTSEAIEEGVVGVVGYDKDKIVRYSSKLIEDIKFYNKMSSNTKVYGDGTASKTI